jgi:hypothetical protein
MKLWLDDERNAPEGWVLVKTALDAIVALRRDEYEEISLDHDLGEGGTGYDVLLYIEAEVHRNPNYKCPRIWIHSANPVGRQRMQRAIDSIFRYVEDTAADS